jgi:hypothetical protein
MTNLTKKEKEKKASYPISLSLSSILIMISMSTTLYKRVVLSGEAEDSINKPNPIQINPITST